MTTESLRYNWTSDVEPYLDDIQAVEGGYSLARRGSVILSDGKKVFVKIAEGEVTQKWLKKEIRAYQILNQAGYPFIPKLLSFDDGRTSMAIEYLEGASFENTWNNDKLTAVLNAQRELTKYKDLFTDDEDFTLGSVVGLDSKWETVLRPGNVEIINKKFVNLGVDVIFSHEQLELFQKNLEGWAIRDETLVHQDLRADNFGYDSNTKTGKLVDWNWLCIGDESLDRTPLFVNMYISGFDPYKLHPETYDRQMLIYLVSFWLERILMGNEESGDSEFKRRKAQATSVKASIELLSR